MTADTKNKNITSLGRRWKWYSHPLPLIVLLCFEIFVGFCIWYDMRPAVLVDRYRLYICNLLLILHPVALLVGYVAWFLWEDCWWWDGEVVARVLLVIFGGLQWYALTWAGIAIYRRRRRRMRPLGHCAVCWYDLYGNTSGVCPECGTPIPDEIGHEIMEELSEANADL